jgi:hypothetical protein
MRFSLVEGSRVAWVPAEDVVVMLGRSGCTFGMVGAMFGIEKCIIASQGRSCPFILGQDVILSARQ